MTKTTKTKTPKKDEKSSNDRAKHESTANPTDSQAKMPKVNVLTQYIKDFSFENPNAPKSLQVQKNAPQPHININVNVNANPLSNANDNNDFEVELKIEATATRDKNDNNSADKMFHLELIYSGIFHLANIPQENKPQVILVECPRLLFPFARQIIAEATRNGGFAPLMIDLIDFAALFRDRASRQNQANLTPNIPATKH